MSIEQIRAAVSVLYKGTWADRVAKMSDNQVAAIYQRDLDKKRRKAQSNSSIIKENN